jgi:hypothetical protein
LGYDIDTANLREIGQGIVNLIHTFDSNSAAIDSILDDPHGAAADIDVDMEEDARIMELQYVDSDLTLPEVKAAFELMGLPYPDLSPLLADQRKSPVAAPRSGGAGRRKPSSYLRKLAVKLPNGSDSEMVLDLESNIDQQIELFLLSNNLSDYADIRKRLLDVSARLLDEYTTQQQPKQVQTRPFDPVHADSNALSSSSSSSSAISPAAATSAIQATKSITGSDSRDFSSSTTTNSIYVKDMDDNASVMSAPRRGKGVANMNKTSMDICATRKCKVRINLSSLSDDIVSNEDDPEENDALFIDVIVQKGEVLSDVAERICREFEGSSDGDEFDNELKQKILDQLILSC